MKYYAIIQSTNTPGPFGLPEGFIIDVRDSNVLGTAEPGVDKALVEFDGTDEDVIALLNGDAQLQKHDSLSHQVVYKKEPCRTQMNEELQALRSGKNPPRHTYPSASVVDHYVFAFMDEFTERTKHIPLHKKQEIFPHSLLEPYDLKYYVGIDGIAFEWIQVSRQGRIYYDPDQFDILDHQILGRVPRYVHCPASFGKNTCNHQCFIYMRSAYGDKKEVVSRMGLFDRPHRFITEPRYLMYIHNIAFEIESDLGRKARHIKFMQILGDCSEQNLTIELARERAKGFASQLILGYATANTVSENSYEVEPNSTPESATLQLLKNSLDGLDGLLANDDVTEPMLQKHFEAHPWLLLRGLNYSNLEPHPRLQFHDSAAPQDPLVPDFLLKRFDDYCDILDLKLPQEKLVVGLSGRHSKLSESVQKAKTQVEDYERYFQEGKHREHILNKYGLKVSSPCSLVLIGKKPDHEMERFLQLSSKVEPFRIKTYDDLVLGLRQIIEWVEKVIV